MRKSSLKCALTALTLAGMTQAGSINFENPPSGLVPNSSFIAGTSVDADAQLTNQFESLGAIFNTIGGSPYAALIDLGTGHAVSGTNGVGTVSSANTLDYTLDLDILLVVPGTLTPAVTDTISIRGDEIPSFGNVIYSAYDTLGNLVASGVTQDQGGSTFSLSAPGIHEFRLHSVNGDVAYDDLVFDTPVAPSPTGPSGAPEPATLGLSGLALAAGLLGLRKR
jgi:hypothetical protein